MTTKAPQSVKTLQSGPISQTRRKGNGPEQQLQLPAEDNISPKQIDLVEKKKSESSNQGHSTRLRSRSYGCDIVKSDRGIEREVVQLLQKDPTKLHQVTLDDVNNSSMWTLAKSARYSRLPVFLPYSTHMSVIECSMVICLLYVAIVTPLQLSYLDEIQKFDNLKPWIGFFILDRCIDLFFVLDMFVSFRTAWMTENDYMVYNEKEAIEKYVGTLSEGPGWFWIDLLSVIPYKTLDLISNGTNFAGLGVLRFLRVLKLMKLVRVFKGVKVYLRAEKIVARKVGYSTLRLVVFFFILIFISHILSCGLYVVYTYGKHNGEYTWLHAYDETHVHQSDYKERLAEVYLIGFYWGMMTITTVGYGDITAQNSTERLFFSVVMLMTTFIFSYIIGNICDLVNNQNTAALEFQSWHDSMNNFFSEQNIPEKLRNEARIYGRYLHDQGQLSDTTVLDKLSESLRRRILMNLYGGYLRKVRFFIGASDELLGRLCEVLQFQTEAAEQFIFQEGHNGDSMYVVVNGILKSSRTIKAKLKLKGRSMKPLSRQKLNSFQITESGDIAYVSSLEKGDVFGYESLVFKNKPRQMSVSSETICQMFELTRYAFDNVM